MKYLIIKLIIIHFLIQTIFAEPFLAGLLSTAVVGLGTIFYQRIKLSCPFSECCEDKSKWITKNITSKIYS